MSHCVKCYGVFADYENMAYTGNGEYWHLKCFVCAHCFRPFGEDQEYYEFLGRKYCQKDFCTLFAPYCSRCNQNIIGRFIRALNKCWHPNCFLCHACSIPLADQGFIRSNNRALCHNCNAKEKASIIDKQVCHSCKGCIEEELDGKPLRYDDETYHAYHFNCCSCGIELNSNARQLNNDLYCLRCYDQRDGVPICGGCRRPIDDERIVTALGKFWHCEHFACSSCDKPFRGKKYYEVKGLAYCEVDYKRLFDY